jgi:hypothetical protein
MSEPSSAEAVFGEAPGKVTDLSPLRGLPLKD